MKKAKLIIGSSVLDEPAGSLTKLKFALRICAAFRGCYLDFREKAMAILKKMKEEKESLSNGGEDANRKGQQGVAKAEGGVVGHGRHAGGGGVDKRSGMGGSQKSEEKVTSQKDAVFCSWPPRNSPVFSAINGIMERPDWKEIVKIPFGMLPVGSGNALAAATLYESQ